VTQSQSQAFSPSSNSIFHPHMHHSSTSFHIIAIAIIGILATAREKISVIWFSTISLVWKTRNDMIFNYVGYDWEKVLEEIKILSWRILKARSKGFTYDLSMWRTNPLACLGAV
jgi:hypothetical protein